MKFVDSAGLARMWSMWVSFGGAAIATAWLRLTPQEQADVLASVPDAPAWAMLFTSLATMVVRAVVQPGLEAQRAAKVEAEVLARLKAAANVIEKGGGTGGDE